MTSRLPVEASRGAVAEALAELLLQELSLAGPMTVDALAKRLHVRGFSTRSGTASQVLKARPATFTEDEAGIWSVIAPDAPAVGGQETARTATPPRAATRGTAAGGIGPQAAPAQPPPADDSGPRRMCRACEKPLPFSAFADGNTPRCRTCVAARPMPKWSNAPKPKTRGGIAGALPSETSVFITRGGSTYHVDRECIGRRAGQAEAASMGYHLHRVEEVQVRSVSASRRPCRVCIG